MPRRVVDLDVVRELALALPDVEESTSWGATSFKVGGRLFACEAIHSSAEDGTLMVRIDTNLRADELITGLNDAGIEARSYYRVPVHRQPAMREFGNVDLPGTDEVARTNFALPMGTGLQRSDVEQVVHKLKELC